MICYLCATPYHIIAATTMASGIFKGEESQLIIYNHFEINEEMADKIRALNLFGRVDIYDYRYISTLDNIKRAIHCFFPSKVMRDAAHDRRITKYVFFALDMIASTYIISVRRRRSDPYEVVFADDGIGAYTNANCYKPKKKPLQMLNLLHRKHLMDEITKLYVYKPDYVVNNRQFELLKIEQNEDTYRNVNRLVREIWPLQAEIDLTDSILFFEQPEQSDEMIARVQEQLHKAERVLGRKIFVKMHPRSLNRDKWQDFTVLNTAMPFDAMLFQFKGNIRLLMSYYSTAQFVPYILDSITGKHSDSIVMNHMLYGESKNQTEFVQRIQDSLTDSDEKIYYPKSVEEYDEILCMLAGK